MTDFILLLIIGACWTWGVHCLFTSGYILGDAGNRIRQWFGRGAKPYIDCPPCMASIHGFIISSAYYHMNIFEWCDVQRMDIYRVIAYMVCLCGLNFIIKSILYPEYESEDVSPD